LRIARAARNAASRAGSRCANTKPPFIGRATREQAILGEAWIDRPDTAA